MRAIRVLRRPTSTRLVACSSMHERFELLVEPPESEGVYTKTTVPKMAAVTPDAIARFDPRREPDDDD